MRSCAPVTLEDFLTVRQSEWDELAELIDRSGGRPHRLGAAGVRRLGALYRAAAADLAWARRRHPGDPVVRRLEALVGGGRAALYGGRRGGSVRAFLARGYWRRIAERPRLLALAWALLLVPASAGALWGLLEPGTAVGLVPGQFADAADPPAAGRDFTAAESAVFSTAVLTNNIQVAFFAFAAGVTYGAGSAFIVALNGAILGAVVGLAVEAGNGAAVVKLVSAHGPLELSCVVVGGYAGLRMGAALLDPGPRRRGAVLVEEARRAVELALGTVPWLVLCGFVEGYLTGPELSLAAGVVIGAALFALFWGLVLWRGRAPSDRAAGLGA